MSLEVNLKLRKKLDEIFPQWDRYKLNQIKNELDEMEMESLMSEDNKLEEADYQYLTQLIALCKQRLFNLTGEYLNRTGAAVNGAITEITNKEDFDLFMKGFIRAFSSYDILEDEMKNTYERCIETLQKHRELRL